jgi:hypothetical protein
VPAGAEVLHAIPPSTAQLVTGEGVGILRPGDRVLVTGFSDADPSHPFRGSLAPIAGPHIVVHPVEPERGPHVGDIVLSSWRPAIAYIVVVSVAAILALAAAPLSESRPCAEFNVGDYIIHTCPR